MKSEGESACAERSFVYFFACMHAYIKVYEPVLEWTLVHTFSRQREKLLDRFVVYLRMCGHLEFQVSAV